MCGWCFGVQYFFFQLILVVSSKFANKVSFSSMYLNQTRRATAIPQLEVNKDAQFC